MELKSQNTLGGFNKGKEQGTRVGLKNRFNSLIVFNMRCKMLCFYFLVNPGYKFWKVGKKVKLIICCNIRKVFVEV